MRSTTKFKKIKVAKDGQGVIFSFSQTAVSEKNGLIESDAPAFTVHKAPHQDFCNAFHAFIPHLLYSMELQKITVTDPDWFDNQQFLEDERFEGITVNSVQIIDKDESKIRLLGLKTTSTGDVCALNGPIIDLHTDSGDRYLLQSVLADAFKVFLVEADEYWSNQKYAANPQQELAL